MKEFQAVKAAGIEIASFVNHVAISGSIRTIVSARDWPLLVKELDYSTPGRYGFNNLGEDEAAALRNLLLFEAISSSAKIEPDKAKKNDCTRVVESVGY